MSGKKPRKLQVNLITFLAIQAIRGRGVCCTDIPGSVGGRGRDRRSRLA